MKLFTLLIKCLFPFFILTCCGKSKATDGISLNVGQAYYHIQIKKMYDGSKDFDLHPYTHGFAGDSVSMTKIRSIVGDGIDLVYVVDIPHSKTSSDLRSESEKIIESLRKIADFSLDIQTWNGK